MARCRSLFGSHASAQANRPACLPEIGMLSVSPGGVDVVQGHFRVHSPLGGIGIGSVGMASYSVRAPGGQRPRLPPSIWNIIGVWDSLDSVVWHKHNNTLELDDRAVELHTCNYTVSERWVLFLHHLAILLPGLLSWDEIGNVVIISQLIFAYFGM